MNIRHGETMNTKKKKQIDESGDIKISSKFLSNYGVSSMRDVSQIQRPY